MTPALVSRGGWTTRHYGRPEAGVHAIQMELAQRLRVHLKTTLERLEEVAGTLSPGGKA